MDFESAYKRIVGGTEDEKRAAAEDIRRVVSKPSETLSAHEEEKTEKDVEIIEHTAAAVDEMIRKWGGDPILVPLDHIHVLKTEGTKDATKGGRYGGVHYPMRMRIGVDRSDSAIEFSSGIAHELFHLKSPKAAQIMDDGDWTLYRSGMSMIDRKGGVARGQEVKFFSDMEEAIVAECTKKFLKALARDSSLEPYAGAEMAQLEQFKKWVINFRRSHGVTRHNDLIDEVKNISNLADYVATAMEYDNEKDRESYAGGVFRALAEDHKIEPLERYDERSRLYNLMDEIKERSGGRFTSRDEVFDQFAKANFTGNYLALARLIEETLGKGSFRKIAEDFARRPKENDPPK